MWTAALLTIYLLLGSLVPEPRDDPVSPPCVAHQDVVVLPLVTPRSLAPSSPWRVCLSLIWE